MKNKQFIKLSTLFSEKINSRSAVRLIFDQFDDVKHVTIDFSGIHFISRAAAHEMAILLENFQIQGYSISLNNVSAEVNKMLNTVSESRKVDFKKATFVKRIIFSSEQELENHLLSF